MKAFNKIILLIVTVFSISFLTGCEKDKLTLLTEGTWYFEDFTTESTNTDIMSLVALGKAFFTDGTMDFSSDGTYVTESPLFDPLSGTWDLVGENLLNMTEEGEILPTPSTIEELSKNTLIYTQSFVYLDVTPYTVTYTWTR